MKDSETVNFYEHTSPTFWAELGVLWPYFLSYPIVRVTWTLTRKALTWLSR